MRAFFLDNPGRREVAFELAGKPLLLWWLGTHTVMGTAGKQCGELILLGSQHTNSNTNTRK